jgi:hypothetical protein
LTKIPPADDTNHTENIFCLSTCTLASVISELQDNYYFVPYIEESNCFFSLSIFLFLDNKDNLVANKVFVIHHVSTTKSAAFGASPTTTHTRGKPDLARGPRCVLP